MSPEGAWVLLLIATVLNGSFVVPFKIEPAKTLQPTPLVFMHYMAVGIFISCWLAQAFLPVNDHFIKDGSTKFDFIPLGLLSGLIWILCMLSSFAAVKHIELSLGNGIWSGVTVMTSYLIALLLFKERPKIVAFSVIGILLLIASVVAIANCKEIAKFYINKTSAPESTDVAIESVKGGIMNPLAPHANFETESNHAQKKVDIETKPKSVVLGILFAISTGIFGGSALAPLNYINTNNQGLTYLPSIGVSALITPPLILLTHNCYYILFGDDESKKSLWPNFHFWQVSLYGIASGLIWMTNNILALAAIPILGYGIALPILQCSIFVGGMWGIFFFNEIDGMATKVFFIAAGVLLLGAIFLSIGGLHT